MSNTVISDVTKSTQAIVHQLWVALEQCYEMGEGQCVLVEKEGDVAISGVSTTEVKLYDYDDDLTDGHLNIWKTLRNWMDPNSHPEQYVALILRTNQSYGERTRFKDWNNSNIDAKIRILESILADSNQRLEKAIEKRIEEGKPAAEPSDSHLIQQSVLKADKRLRLREVVSKFFIADESPGFVDTYDRLKSSKCGHIPKLNQDQYLGALLNVVIRPETIENNWAITKESFDEALKLATSKFCQGSKRFPKLYRADPADPPTFEYDKLLNYQFVEKIRAINHTIRIPQAIRDYHETQGIILKDFQSHSVELPEYIGFVNETEAQFELGYSIAQQTPPKNSKLFYDKTMREDATDFAGFDFAPREFKNGIIHMHLNNESKQHKWKLDP